MAALQTAQPTRVWSDYQNAIFDFVANETGDLVIDAKAGSGKSSTLKEIARRLDFAIRCNTIFLAFNTHIADALGKELPSCMTASTIHSQGRRATLNYCKSICPNFVEANWKLDGSKYNKLVKHWYATEFPEVTPTSEWRDEISKVIKLTRLVQLTLTNAENVDVVRMLAARFQIGFFANSWDRVAKCIPCVLRRGLVGIPPELRGEDGRSFAITETVSYDDMVWAPCVLDMTIQQYALLLVDECQDLNPAQRQLVQLMKGDAGRAIWVGDKKQAIYAFAGADSAGIDEIIRMTGATELPLNVCYRCPASHIKLAQALVPGIEAAPNAKEGTVAEIHPEDVKSYVRKGDLILCRCIAPLAQVCIDLIINNIPATIKGKDVASGLNTIIDNTIGLECYRDFKTGGWKNFIASLNHYITIQSAMLSQYEGSEMEIEKLTDQCEAITSIYKAKYSQLRGTDDLKNIIDSLFSDKNAAVTLSTIHKAKGLEAERVGILRYDLLPHPRANTLEQLEQEENLEYIILTRSMDTIFFIEENAERLVNREDAVVAAAPIEVDPFDQWDLVGLEAMAGCRLDSSCRWFYLNGNTYPSKDILKAKYGARFDGKNKAWMVTEHQIVEAQKLVNGR